MPDIVNYTANVPIDGCKGNHDNAAGTARLSRSTSPSLTRTLTPRTGSSAKDSNNNPYYNNLYWSFDYGPVHFTIIDEYSTMTQGSAQYNWVVADLAAASANPNTPWKIIMYHEPAYSAGADGDNTAVRIFEGAGGAPTSSPSTAWILSTAATATTMPAPAPTTSPRPTATRSP